MSEEAAEAGLLRSFSHGIQFLPNQPSPHTHILSFPHTSPHLPTQTLSAPPLPQNSVSSHCVSNIIRTAHLRHPTLPHFVPFQAFPPLHVTLLHIHTSDPCMSDSLSFFRHSLAFLLLKPLFRLCSDLNCPPSISTPDLHTLPQLLKQHSL